MNRGVQPWSTKVSNFKPTFLVLKIYVNDEFKIYVNEEFLAPHMLLKWQHVARCNKSSQGTIPKLTDEDALLWCSPLMQIWILWSYDVKLSSDANLNFVIVWRKLEVPFRDICKLCWQFNDQKTDNNNQFKSSTLASKI